MRLVISRHIYISVPDIKVHHLSDMTSVQDVLFWPDRGFAAAFEQNGKFLNKTESGIDKYIKCLNEPESPGAEFTVKLQH